VARLEVACRREEEEEEEEEEGGRGHGGGWLVGCWGWAGRVVLL
jgi:hypothetical protein